MLKIKSLDLTTPQPVVLTPTKRINSIDALRGFALFCILLLHCIEHFALIFTPEQSSPFWQLVDDLLSLIMFLLFDGKAYAIFSLLFGLSFFMQMDSQASKGIDFRWRFVWRLAILFGLGYLNGLIYIGEFFVVYAILGLILIPLYKVSSKWLLVIAVLAFLQIPDIISFISLLNGDGSNMLISAILYLNGLFNAAISIFMCGSLMDVVKFNIWEGQLVKLLIILSSPRCHQLIGLFIVGMLIGRCGIHKSEEKMIHYSKKVLPYSIFFFILFFLAMALFRHTGANGFALQVGTMLFKSYSDLWQMMLYICTFILLYYNTRMRKILDHLAPVGRMSVTNYMMQSIIGVSLFYGFGGNLAVQLSLFQCVLLGFIIYSVQVLYSNWWMKRYYYGPVEWLWRVLTWFKRVPFRRLN